MHHGMEVIQLIESSTEPVLRRFTLDCAERVLARMEASPLWQHLDVQRSHLSTGRPDAGEVRGLLEALWERDDLDGAAVVGWAIDNDSPADEAAREAALEAAQGAESGSGSGLPTFFRSDNEELWQARRLRWLQRRAPEQLWGPGEAPYSASMGFDPERVLSDILSGRGRHHARVLARLDGEEWSVLLEEQGLCAAARGMGGLKPGQSGVVCVQRGALLVSVG